MKVLLIIIFSIFIFSCKKSEKENLYNNIALDFCKCYNSNSFPDFSKGYSECLRIALKLYDTSLAKFGITEFASKEYGEMLNSVLAESRMKKYCPTYITGFTDVIKRLEQLKNIKVKFTGTFLEQQQIGTGTKKLYSIVLKNQNDSLINFFSNDSINLNHVENNVVLIVYHLTGDSSNFVDSIIYK